jgi:hypothetical protein
MRPDMHNRFLFNNGMSANSTETFVFNLPKLMSSANRKTFHNVDMKGNAQLYTVGIKVFGTDVDALISAAPNTYITRRAVKDWHDARVAMYARAGIKLKDLGYGATLRPYLNVNHENGTVDEIDTENGVSLGITPHFKGEEWTYSRAAVATPMENTISGEGNPNTADLVDTYSFTLCGESVQENVTADDPDESTFPSDQDSFVSVGMIAEWLDSFRMRSPEGTANVSFPAIDDDNALLQLRSLQGADKEEVLELAQDSQRENRPWGTAPSDYYDEVFAGYARSILSGSDYVVCQVPCGLLQLAMETTPAETVTTQIEVLAIEDM